MKNPPAARCERTAAGRACLWRRCRETAPIRPWLAAPRASTRPRRSRALQGRVEDGEPARQILFDRKLSLELRLQLELLRVVALLPFAFRHERPEGTALEAVDPEDPSAVEAPALEGEHRRQQLGPEA